MAGAGMTLAPADARELQTHKPISQCERRASEQGPTRRSADAVLYPGIFSLSNTASSRRISSLYMKLYV